MLRKLISWINKRFPEQYVVTAEEFNEMRQELASYNKIAQGVIEFNIRLASLESQVGRLNASNGFVTAQKGAFTLER